MTEYVADIADHLHRFDLLTSRSHPPGHERGRGCSGHVQTERRMDATPTSIVPQDNSDDGSDSRGDPPILDLCR